MAGHSTYVQTSLANWFRGTAMPTAPASLELALSTVSLSDNGSNIAEPSIVNGYARQVITLTAPVHTENAGTLVQNSNSIIFPTVTTATWGTIVAAAVFDAVSGQMLFEGDLVAPRNGPVGDTLSFGVGTLQFRVR